MIFKETIDDFFNRYASIMNNALFGGAYEIDTIMGSFSQYVVGANPLGVAGGRNDAQFASTIRKGIEFYRKIGIISMNILSKEISILDDFHAIVRIFWSSFYETKERSGEIPFEVTYFVQCRDGEVKIFAFVAGDEQAAFKSHHLVSEEETHGAKH